ncbi:MAG: NAD(P)H-dependent glycerol-3-phosphate dehydrogenase [Anaerovoracaceae bacterium]|nr:NAD(P)H-dependent glycerol-3-phosphate dehydrogenase [Bacillota bacterium]MDY2670267.1 NAD(P)H-dependent glycerol-3-phosphate dehydrogenase [Anaerovoracaceae bacterium]
MTTDKKERAVSVIGAGSWGTAISISLASGGHDVILWGRNREKMSEAAASRENRKYLQDVKIPENVEITSDLEYALRDRDIVIFVVPAQAFRETFANASEYLKPGTVVVNCAKGIELGTLKRVSEIVKEIRPDLPFVVLSGPSHAEEVGRLMPTTLTAASDDEGCAKLIQDLFMTESMRVYTNDDVVGVEVGGALKNIIALAAGISDGMGYGDNAKAALMTRGLTEMARMGEKMGGERITFMGLAGLGDLIVTCTSMHSRNRRCGILIGQGVEPSEAIKQVGMVVEGIQTTEAAYQLSKKLNVEMPITEQLHLVIEGSVKGPEAVRNLMLRKRKNEGDD